MESLGLIIFFCMLADNLKSKISYNTFQSCAQKAAQNHVTGP